MIPTFKIRLKVKRQNHQRPGRCRLRTTLNSGFTLIEAMVVLILTTLLFGILLAALNYLAHINRAISNAGQERERAASSALWMLTSLRACLPEIASLSTHFVGTTDQINCETTAPLLPRAVQGVPMPIQLKIEALSEQSESAVRYSEGKVPSTSGTFSTQASPAADETKPLIARFPGVGLSFLYLDSKGEKQKKWPPKTYEVLIDPQADLAKLFKSVKPQESLPSSILVLNAAGETLMQIRPQASPWTRATRNPLSQAFGSTNTSGFSSF